MRPFGRVGLAGAILGLAVLLSMASGFTTTFPGASFTTAPLGSFSSSLGRRPQGSASPGRAMVGRSLLCQSRMGEERGKRKDAAQESTRPSRSPSRGGAPGESKAGVGIPQRQGSGGSVGDYPQSGPFVYRRSSLMRKPTARVQRLRDLLFQKESIEVLTTAEFALTLDMSKLGAAPEEEELRNIAAIDYDRISRKISSLYGSIYDNGAGKTIMSPTEIKILAEKLTDMQIQVQRRMREGTGIASVAKFNDEPVKSRSLREGAVNGGEGAGAEGAKRVVNLKSFIEDTIGAVGDALSPETYKRVAQRLKSLVGEVKKSEDNLEMYFQAFVREDGSLDFDAVKVPKRDELVRMGGELWERLNGVPPGEEAPCRNITTLKLAVKQSQDVLALQAQIEEAEALIDPIEKVRLDAYAELDEFRQGGGVLEADMEGDGDVGEGEGFGMDDGGLDRLDPDFEAEKCQTRSKYARRLSKLMKRLRSVEKDLLEAEQRLRLRQLDLDMERIAMYIEYEIGQMDDVQDQMKLLVAEFGLLDGQIGALRRMSEQGGGTAMLQDLDDGVALNKVGLVDEDELLVVAGDVDDLLRRLGVDEMLEETPQFSPIPKFSFSEIQQKAVDGASFYVLGTKLMASDWAYSASLIFKAAIKGQTLSPREVRTLRRAFKDTTTFIPFIVILIIPLSPVGHVLVFSFIQRFFPDFFPSPYTDRRQNLMRMYQAVEMNIPTSDGGASRGMNGVGSMTRSAPGRRMRSTQTLIERGKNQQQRVRGGAWRGSRDSDLAK